MIGFDNNRLIKFVGIFLSQKLYWISTTSSAEFCEISTNPQSSTTADRERMYPNEIKLL